MARAFLYVVAGIVLLILAGAVALRLFPDELQRFATVPPGAYASQPAFAENRYAEPALWLAQPGTPGEAAARTLPQGATRGAPMEAAVFFIHPTSFASRTAWNDPLTDADARTHAGQYVRAMASSFGDATEIWAPRYRQATLGAFLTDRPDAREALDLAHGDVLAAFDWFIAHADKHRPIVLVGHSQGAYLLLRLLKERVAGTPLAGRIAAVYIAGWPVSKTHDLPLMGLAACSGPAQAGCIMSWQSYGEPAAPPRILPGFVAATALDGGNRLDVPPLCTNPLTGGAPGAAPASANHGTFAPSEDLASATLRPGLVPAQCDANGLLLIGDPPDLGPFVLPGNNYHVYDIMLFWQNLREDVRERVAVWRQAH
jgi:hypothetical protein